MVHGVRDRGVRPAAGVRLGGRGPGIPGRDLAVQPGAAAGRDAAEAVGAGGAGAFGVVGGDRADAGQGTEDRVRAAAGVRGQHGGHAGRGQAAGRAVVRTATTIEASDGDWAQTVEFVREAERLGLDICWVAEAWGSEAPSALGYLAARTSRLLLGSGIIQLGTRTPVAIARAAITLSNISGGRFLLGLGASGPQVIEGLHGVSFARPLSRLRETVDIVRQVIGGA